MSVIVLSYFPPCLGSKVSHVTRAGLLPWPSWLASSPCKPHPHLLNTETTNAAPFIFFFMWCLGTKLTSSCLHSKHLPSLSSLIPLSSQHFPLCNSYSMFCLYCYFCHYILPSHYKLAFTGYKSLLDFFIVVSQSVRPMPGTRQP